MSFKPINLLFLLFAILNFSACTSDENALSLGDDAINDKHNAAYTEDFEIYSETLLAEYVLTNNTGVALCGSYYDDYIGRITTNTVFKFSPNIKNNAGWYNMNFKRTAELDSIVVFLHTNDYLYGDSTKTITLDLHALTSDYGLDDKELTNYTTTPFDSNAIGTVSFIPKDIKGDTLAIRIDDAIAQAWFDSIVAESSAYIIDVTNTIKNDNDQKFIDQVIPGLTIRSKEDNQAIIGFKMPIGSTTDFSGLSTVRMYYTTQYPLTHQYQDFKIYQAKYQYNQITADFSQGLLAGIEAGGEGIPSSQTEGLTFVQSGLGLMTKIELPTLNKLYTLGNELTILDLDLYFKALPYSFNDFYPVPTDLLMHRLKQNGKVDYNGINDLDGNRSTIYTSSSDKFNISYGAGITLYGIDEQLLWNNKDPKHTSILISPLSNNISKSTVNRLVIGDASKEDCEMKAAMYYTTFE